MQRRTFMRFECVIAFIVAGAVIVSVGCATTSGSLLPPEQLMAQNIAGKDADITSLQRGRALTVTECATCHRLYWPQEYSPEEWERIIRKMGRLASLSETQIRDIQLYMMAASGHQRGGDGIVQQ